MKALDKFGQFVVANLRDKAIEQYDMLLEGKLKGVAMQDLQTKVALLSDEQKALTRKLVLDVIDTAMHDFLFSIQDAHDRRLGIEVFVDGTNVAEESEMLNGEHIGEGGWIERYSRYS